MNTEIIPLGDRLPADISPDTRTFINALAMIKDLEQRLPLIDSIEEIERLRIHTVTISGIARVALLQQPTNEANDLYKLAKDLDRWAIRVGIMCQRRVGQLLNTIKLSPGGRHPKKPVDTKRQVFEVPAPPPVTLESLGLKRDYAATAKILASVPEKELKSKLDQQEADGGLKKQKLIKQIRNEAKAKGETLDEKTAQRLAQHRIRNERVGSKIKQERAKTSPRQRTSPSDKFKVYWSKEKKLLYQYFEASDLEKVGEYWWREFNAYRAEEEKILSEARQERERRRGLAELTKP